jgi:hypothetical protein
MAVGLGTAAAAGLNAPEWVWIATTIVAGLLLVAAIVLYVSGKRTSKDPGSTLESGGTVDQSVTSHGQSGGITAHTVTKSDQEENPK